MAPPIKPDDERKTPRAVSLTKRQRATLKKLGGSPWLQNILDREAALMERGRKALPHLTAHVVAQRARRHREAEDHQNRDSTVRMHAIAHGIAPWPAFDGEPGTKPAKKKGMTLSYVKKARKA